MLAACNNFQNKYHFDGKCKVIRKVGKDWLWAMNSIFSHSVQNRTVLLSFPDSVIKHPDRRNLRKGEGFFFLCLFFACITSRKSRQLGLEAVGHSTLVIRSRGGWIHAAAQLPSSTYTVQDPIQGMVLPTVGMSSYHSNYSQDTPPRANPEVHFSMILESAKLTVPFNTMITQQILSNNSWIYVGFLGTTFNSSATIFSTVPLPKWVSPTLWWLHCSSRLGGQSHTSQMRQRKFQG